MGIIGHFAGYFLALIELEYFVPFNACVCFIQHSQYFASKGGFAHFRNIGQIGQFSSAFYVRLVLWAWFSSGDSLLLGLNQSVE